MLELFLVFMSSFVLSLFIFAIIGKDIEKDIDNIDKFDGDKF